MRVTRLDARITRGVLSCCLLWAALGRRLSKIAHFEPAVATATSWELNWPGMSAIGVRREKAALSRVQIPPGNRSSRKQPEQLWR